MARIDSNLPGFIKPPEDNHLAMYIDGPTKGATAIIPGTGITIVEFDGQKEPHLFPLVLVSVSHRSMKFKCSCGKAECTRELKFKGVWTGKHPYREGDSAMLPTEADS